MKHLLSTLVLALAATAAQAQSYNYLTFEKADGTQQSLATVHTVITFAGGNLTATDRTGASFTAPLSEMSRMFFSAEATGIAHVAQNASEVKAIIVNGTLHVNAPKGSTVEVYSLDGRKVNANGLNHGTYLVRVNNTTLKVMAL